MGLFSFLNKNKQEAAVPDSGYYSSADDDAVAARARSKRASSAGEPAARRRESKTPVDPVLPEKKRARRRLVGAIALALAVAIGLPMILDSEPKTLAGDIDIRIPSKDRAPAQPLPRPVEAADALDKREQIVDAPADPAPAPVLAPAPAPAAPLRARDVAELKPVLQPKPETKAVKPDPKPVEKLAEKHVLKPARVEEKPAVDKPAVEKPVVAKVADKAPERVAEKHADKAADKAADKPVDRLVEKPAARPPEAERALSILEGKAIDKPADEGGQKHVVQVAALASQEKVTELQDKLRDAGIRSYTQKVPTQSGERIRVLVGPFSKDEAEKIKARLGKLGISGSMVRG